MDIKQPEKFRQFFFKYKIHFILFWIIVYIVMTLRQLQNMLMSVVLISNFTFLSATSLYACFVLFYLLPKFGYNKKVLLFFVYSIAGLGVMSVLNAFTDHWVYVNFGVHPVRSDFTYLIPVELVFTFLVSASFGSIKIAEDYLNAKWKNEKLQSENLGAELKFLKSQLNPHFLFNTLNNLYFMIKQNPERASEMLLKLSGIMRYQLYETGVEKISLKKELENVNNYIELEKIRKEDNMNLEIDMPDDIKDCRVPPYILLPFIENAFKHLSNFDNKKNSIEVRLSQNNGSLEFNVKNSREEITAVKEHNGIGIANIKRRLELLYPQKYVLVIKKDNNFYEINLVLNTNEN